MTKQNGLGDGLLVGGYDLSGDIGSIGNVHGGCAVQDVTGIDKFGMERIGALFDASLEFSAFWNDAAGRSHAILSPLPTTSAVLTYLRGRGIGSPAAGLVAKRVDYPPKRGADGALTIDVAAQASDGTGLDWGEQLTPGFRTDTGAANGASYDAGASTAFGLAAYLHLLGFTGTSVTVKIQHSTDGSTWADLLSFTAATAVGAQRLATGPTATVNRYLRAVTTGTFTSAQFVVVGSRRLAASAW